ncbi:MAG: DUF2285 domain-containing protein [Bradyrhizobium sp.]|nr:DUF2285 domain-containing protein [Bradyrhizobium sp.]
MLPSVLKLDSTAAVPSLGRPHNLDLRRLSREELRHAPDGWHVVTRMGGATHRFWLDKLPADGRSLILHLPLDADFDLRAHAAHRFWSALEKRPVAPSRPVLSLERCQRLTLALRALDGRTEGNSYRTIAEVLFGSRRIPERSWKTHDLRSRTIRLVQSGLSLMRGGYRALLRRGYREH